MENDFIEAARDIVNVPKSKGSITFVRRWMGAFGTPPVVCCRLWGMINPCHIISKAAKYKHLLWGLFFLKVYENETNSAKAVGGVDEKTYRKWIWPFVEAISYLECNVILWENRFLGDTGNRALTTLDGTDMPAQMSFAEEFMSVKFKGRGVKYELGVCINTGDLVWLHGPVRAGEHDLNLARQAFISSLDDNEMAVSDKGYRGEEKHLKTPNIFHYLSKEEHDMAHIAGMRHETANRRIKHFQVLTKQFHHSLTKHSLCFRAVCVITQLNINNGAELFDTEYFDEGRS